MIQNMQQVLASLFEGSEAIWMRMLSGGKHTENNVDLPQAKTGGVSHRTIGHSPGLFASQNPAPSERQCH